MSKLYGFADGSPPFLLLLPRDLLVHILGFFFSISKSLVEDNKPTVSRGMLDDTDAKKTCHIASAYLTRCEVMDP